MGDNIPIHGSPPNSQTVAGKEELDLILFYMNVAFMVINNDGQVIYVNAGAARMMKREPAGMLGNSFWRLFPDLEDTAFQQALERCFRGGESIDFEYFNPSEQCWYEIRAYPGGTGASLFVTDITARKRSKEGLERSNERLDMLVRQRTKELEQTNASLIEEIHSHLRTMQELRLLESITRAISSATDIRTALITVLASICQEAGWALGQTWLPDANGAGLEWCPPSYWREAELEDFRLASQRICFIRGGDLPGRVWASGQTLRVSDIGADPHFLRKEAAHKAGLKVAIAFPVLAGHEVVAVVEFFMRKTGRDDERYITQVTAITGQIGTLIQRKRSEEALRDSEERFRLLIDGARDYAIFMLNPNGLVMSWNKGVERLKGYSSAEVVGRHFSLFYRPEDVSSGRPQRGLNIALRYGRFEDEGWHVRKDGSCFWANIIIRPLHDGRGRLVGFAKITRDLSERKDAHDKLQIYAKQLHLLSQRLLEAQESERRNLARELHDEIGQMLTVIKIGLQRLQEYGDRVDANTLLRDNIATVDHALARVRDMSLDLRPSMLDDFGLVAALRWYADRNSRSTGMIVKFSAAPDIDRFAPEIETVCFRIAQEAMTNVFRHAQAKHVYLTLQLDDTNLSLQVRDDGVGFDISRLDEFKIHRYSFGLFSMRERVSLVGGRLSIDSVPGQGTTVRASFPRIPLAGAAE